jgi:hypothetical protein
MYMRLGIIAACSAIFLPSSPLLASNQSFTFGGVTGSIVPLRLDGGLVATPGEAVSTGGVDIEGNAEASFQHNSLAVERSVFFSFSTLALANSNGVALASVSAEGAPVYSVFNPTDEELLFELDLAVTSFGFSEVLQGLASAVTIGGFSLNGYCELCDFGVDELLLQDVIDVPSATGDIIPFNDYIGDSLLMLSYMLPAGATYELRLSGSILSGAEAAVPEPATWALMLAGFGAVGFVARRRGARWLGAAAA